MRELDTLVAAHTAPLTLSVAKPRVIASRNLGRTRLYYGSGSCIKQLHRGYACSQPLTLACVAAAQVCCVEQLLTDPVHHTQ